VQRVEHQIEPEQSWNILPQCLLSGQASPVEIADRVNSEVTMTSNQALQPTAPLRHARDVDLS